MSESQQKLARWNWTKVKHDALQLLAEDELTDEEISVKVGIRRQTLWQWKKRPEFADALKDAVAAMGEATQRYAVARKLRRLKHYDERHRRLLAIIEERAQATDMQAAPGGSSGLLARSLKMIGSGPSAQMVEEFEVDAALLKELRELEKQVAIEAGQWTEKREHSFDIDAAIEAELARLASSGQTALPGTTAADALPAGSEEDLAESS